jgi:polyisoprenyl-phosphate glycosyltransferase
MGKTMFNSRSGVQYNKRNGSSGPDISVVIPAYFEEQNLPELYESLSHHLNNLGKSWEVILVDDGSGDRTWEVIMSLNLKDPNVKGIQFSRNFGHQYALYAGYLHAQGKAVICMDGDLQHPPDIIPEMVEKWEQGYKIVDTIRKDHEELSFFKKATSKVYYKIFSALSGVSLKPGMADYRLIDRQVLNTLLRFDEEGLFIRGIVGWIGFPRTSIEYQCRARHSGNSSYSVKKMIRFAVEGITSFSIIPLRIAIVIGIVTSLFAFGLTGHSIYLHTIGETVPGWATIIAAMSFLFGVLFLLLGLVGEYIGRILIEVRGRPRFILNETLGINSEPSAVASKNSGTVGIK